MRVSERGLRKQGKEGRLSTIQLCLQGFHVIVLYTLSACSSPVRDRCGESKNVDLQMSRITLVRDKRKKNLNIRRSGLNIFYISHNSTNCGKETAQCSSRTIRISSLKIITKQTCVAYQILHLQPLISLLVIEKLLVSFYL
jgi:hypothetical protein